MTLPRDRLYDLAFFLVEAFAALEVTAVLVANAKITETLGLAEIYSSYILNGYLYPLFLFLVIALVFVRKISAYVSPVPFFITGLVIFALGNAVCFLAAQADIFFFGRVVMGFGAAIAFMGQLWTACLFHGSRITQPLIWGEAGAAIGVVLGPLVGAFFTSLDNEGWRWLFAFNAGLGILTAIIAALALGGKRNSRDIAVGRLPSDSSQTGVYTMTALQAAVSMLAVGGEYLFSDFMQAKAGRSAMFVGWMTTIASVGAIAGSVIAGRMTAALKHVPAFALGGIVTATATLGLCLATGQALASSLPILAMGLCLGMANVSIYALIVHSSQAGEFLPRSLIYLIGMQVGNALGIQAVGIAEGQHLGALATAGTICVPALVLGGAMILRQTVFVRKTAWH